MGVREILGFDVGDLVVKRQKSLYGPKVWEVVSCDLRLRKVELRHEFRDGFQHSTVSPRKLVLIRTAEERVMDAVMGTE